MVSRCKHCMLHNTDKRFEANRHSMPIPTLQEWEAHPSRYRRPPLLAPPRLMNPLPRHRAPPHMMWSYYEHDDPGVDNSFLTCLPEEEYYSEFIHQSPSNENV